METLEDLKMIMYPQDIRLSQKRKPVFIPLSDVCQSGILDNDDFLFEELMDGTTNLES